MHIYICFCCDRKSRAACAQSFARSFCEGCTWHDLSHPGHSTILLRSEILSGMCAKLRTVAATNNRDHPTRSLNYCFFAPRSYSVFIRAHPVRGESHNQRNATREVETSLTLVKARKSMKVLWHAHDINKRYNIRALSCKVKCRCSVERIRNINNLTMGVGKEGKNLKIDIFLSNF